MLVRQIRQVEESDSISSTMQSAEPVYELVGDVYLARYAHGEAMKDARFSLQDFILV
jgi:hypothetical protein